MCGVDGGESQITVTLTHSEAASLDSLIRAAHGFSKKLRTVTAEKILSSEVQVGYVNKIQERVRFVTQEIGA
jgi:hypothetical protein